jgi:serine protease Do
MGRLIVCAILSALSAGCTINGAGELSRSRVIDGLLPSSVQIVLEQDGQRFRSGSGVAIAARGTDCFLLTSGHTLSRRPGNDQVFVLLERQHGTGQKVGATVIGHRDTEELDLALLRAQTTQCSPVRFGGLPRLGDPIWVVAFPWGRNMTLVSGIVSQLSDDPPGDRATAPHFIVDASVSYGSSGGGVYDAAGRLVGVVEGYRTARVSFENDAAAPQHINVPVPGETYVTSLADIRRFLAQVDQQDLPSELRTLGNVPKE